MFYVIAILSSAAVIVLVNLLAVPFAWSTLGVTAASVAIGVVAVIAADGLGALLIRRLTPTCWYMPTRRIFSVSRREYRMYRSLRIPAWKDLIPELGLFTGFSKSDVRSTTDPRYLERFLMESNYGVVIHLENALLGWLIAYIPWCSAPSVWVPIVFVNAVLSLMPVAVLRYTSHTLGNLYRRSRARTARKEH